MTLLDHHCRRAVREWIVPASALLLLATAVAASAGDGYVERLIRAYPDHLSHVDGNMLVWRDGMRMRIDDGAGAKPFEVWLSDPDIKDMLRPPYPPGLVAALPGRNSDPGRARNAQFFEKMYGDCRSGSAAASMTEVVWLPKKSGQRLKVTRVNGVAEKLAAVSRALDALPARFDAWLVPSAGTFNCRPIAGTSRLSAHGYGIAVDIAASRSHYWQWAKPGPDGTYPHQNSVPYEIVEIFEAHGFIWGGKWYHYDTMHFEYRPELLLAP